ncbi:MAG TPA: AraC family transcriptional regulator [Thermoanaerobaculia bacterium]|nr:AraC family transcriptional regulator [Thermoanaerobaculia bacterium]
MLHVPTTYGDPVCQFAAGGFLLYESRYAPSMQLPRHYHDGAALMFATRGAFSETVAGRTLACKTFDVIARPGGEVHTDRYSDDGASCVIVNVPKDRLGRLFDAPAILPRPQVAPIAHRVAQEIAADDDVSPLIVEGLLLELIGTASRPVTCTHAPSWLARARAFIDENASRRVTLHDIASAANVHPTSVVRAFRAHLHCSPGEYVRRVRIDDAKRALEASPKPLGEIALDTGFYDQSHFANAFRRATGMTPQQYRNAFRVQN